ncbi:MAG TPA: hypothetical protein VKB78_12590 [Pirellulales bacterium]|nr:hypothetical protein [Pirellulales bacterium]
MSEKESYFGRLFEALGTGWNRFWFTPSDPFTLAVLRVLTAALAMALYFSYLPDLERLFGPNGLLSEESMLRLRGTVSVFSLFDYADTSAKLWFFYWLGAAAFGLFLIGLLTRVSGVVALVAFLSLIHRGPVLARPVDDIVSMTMLYLCLGPSGAALSIDAWLHRRKMPPTGSPAAAPATSWAATAVTRLIQVQVSLIYFLMALAKLKFPVWWMGTAVWGLLAKPESRLIYIPFLADIDPPGVYALNAWTLAIVGFELCFALLIWVRIARPLLLGLAVPIWIGTALLTGMTSWAVMMLIANLAFVSPQAMRHRLTRQAT